jgi:hypothetical protein
MAKLCRRMDSPLSRPSQSAVLPSTRAIFRPAGRAADEEERLDGHDEEVPPKEGPAFKPTQVSPDLGAEDGQSVRGHAAPY